jgi:hypothetical protein
MLVEISEMQACAQDHLAAARFELAQDQSQ